VRIGCAAAAAWLVASCATPQPVAEPALQIAITIDDLPVHAPYPPGVTPQTVGAQMVTALKAEAVPAYGFVNAVRVNDDPSTEAVLEAWRAAGLELGNHGWSHAHLSEMTVAEFERELTRNEPILAKLGTGTEWHWFRYPFLDEGKNEAQRVAARAMLAAHGYRVADVTTSFADWAWTPAYARCMARKDSAGVAELERMYLDAVKMSIANDRETAQKLYGRDIPYVLLMHISAMSAHMMPQVLRIYRDSGFRFVTLAEAERDPVYAAGTDLRLPPPPSRGEAAKARGVILPAPPDPSARLAAICA
jgi:peptidoglycan/xylan/chitin deacetylase (PgdA/CDA1 family)